MSRRGHGHVANGHDHGHVAAETGPAVGAFAAIEEGEALGDGDTLSAIVEGGDNAGTSAESVAAAPHGEASPSQAPEAALTLARLRAELQSIRALLAD